MHSNCKAHKSIIMINKNRVIWFVCMKTRKLSSVTGWNYKKSTEVIRSYNINLNFRLWDSFKKVVRQVPDQLL